MDLDKINEYRDKQAQEASAAQDEVKHEEVVGSLNNLLMATMVSKDPKMIEVAQNLSELLGKIGEASDQFNNSSLHLLPLANQELAISMRELADKVELHSTADLIPLLQDFTQVVARVADTKPIVNVPKQSVSVDTKPLIGAVNEIKKAIKDSKIDIPETDLTKVVNGLKDLKKTISNLSFPVPNYVLPFRDASGKAVQVQVDSNGKLPTTATIDASDIEIGAVEIKDGGSDNRASVSAGGALEVDGSGTVQPVSGTFWQATQPVSLATVPSHAVTNAGTFLVQVDNTPAVKAEKTASATTSTGVVVGTGSTTIIASNAARKAVVIVNDSDEVVYLKYGSSATANSGIRLNASGGTVREEMYTGIITGICASGSKTVTVTEM